MKAISKYLAITIIAVVGMGLLFAGFVVLYTGSTDCLIPVGRMIALIVGAFRS